MKTKAWILLVGALLVLSLGTSVLLMSPEAASSHAKITSESAVLCTVDLRIDQEFSVDTKTGHNVITVSGGKIAVTEANCPDHTCMHRGFQNSGTPIVCLPNKLVISFVAAEEMDLSVG